MAFITAINMNDQNKWDRVVQSFGNYDVFYLSGYSKAFMKEDPKNGMPILLLYENEKDRAINVVFCRDVAKDGKFVGMLNEGEFFDLITPYGYGGFYGNVSDWDKLNKTYSDYCMENNFICEFIRFELFSDYYMHYEGDVETRTHNVVRSLETSIDDIWMDFKQKVRKNVKRARFNNLELIIDEKCQYIEEFLRLYYGTMDRTEAAKEYYFTKSFYENLKEIRNNSIYFYVAYEGKIISTELVIYGTENCYSYLGGTDRDYFDVRPNDFLKFEIIKWAKKKGLKNFVLGGGYGADDGIFQYKQCLAPHGVVDFYIGRRVFDRSKYEKLVEMRGGENLNKMFFPLYRS